MDLNTILSNAITAAIQEAIKPAVDDLQSVVRNLEDRIEGLDARVFAVEGGLTTLEQGAVIDTKKLLAEDAPMSEAESDWRNPQLAAHPTPAATIADVLLLDKRIDALFTLLSRLIQTDDEAIQDAKDGSFTPHSLFSEWVRKQAHDVAETLVDDAMEEHKDDYEHDDFITEVDEDDVESAVKRVLRGASVSIDL